MRTEAFWLVLFVFMAAAQAGSALEVSFHPAFSPDHAGRSRAETARLHLSAKRSAVREAATAKPQGGRLRISLGEEPLFITGH